MVKLEPDDYPPIRGEGHVAGRIGTTIAGRRRFGAETGETGDLTFVPYFNGRKENV